MSNLEKVTQKEWAIDGLKVMCMVMNLDNDTRHVDIVVQDIKHPLRKIQLAGRIPIDDQG